MSWIANGTKVAPGYYFSLGRWEITHVAAGGGKLPETNGGYLRLPLPALLVVAPFMGLLLVVFLPFIGFAMVFGLVARRAAAALQRTMFDLAALVHPAARPGEAYLTGKREDSETASEIATDAALDKLAGEIAARRHTEKS